MKRTNTDLHFEQNEDFALRVRINQQRLRSDLKSQYDFIVCSGSSGPVIALLSSSLESTHLCRPLGSRHGLLI